MNGKMTGKHCTMLALNLSISLLIIYLAMFAMIWSGMPRGSPGMEMPDGSNDPFQVMAFEASGRTSVDRR